MFSSVATDFGSWTKISLFRSFSVNVLPSWLRNADRWKPDYCVVTNEQPRNKKPIPRCFIKSNRAGSIIGLFINFRLNGEH